MPRGSVDRKNHYMTWYQRALNKRIGERVCRNGTVPGKQPIIQLVSTKAIPTPLVIVSAEGGVSSETPGTQVSVTHFCFWLPSSL